MDRLMYAVGYLVGYLTEAVEVAETGDGMVCSPSEHETSKSELYTDIQIIDIILKLPCARFQRLIYTAFDTVWLCPSGSAWTLPSRTTSEIPVYTWGITPGT